MRPVESADVDQLHELWLDGDVRKYLWDDEQISRDTAEAVVQANLRDWQESGYGLWMARLRAAGELAGFVGYRSSKERAGPELLFGFHPRYWHMGLASEAVRTALAWAFDWLRVDLVWAATDPPNIASIQLMERLGMRMTHRGLLNGKDAVFYEARSAGVSPSDCGRDGRSP